jgi:hypothetical protein
MSTTRTIRIEGSGNQRTIVRPVGPPGPAGVAGTPGTMTGPVGATANAIVLFNGTTGSVVKDSTVTLSSLATTAAVTAALALKQDAEAGKGLSQQNFTTTLKAKLDALGTATYKGSHATLSDLAAAHPAGAAGDWAHVEVLGTELKVYHWDDVNDSWSVGVDLSGKVDKVAGKGLSTNDFTNLAALNLSTAVQTTTFDAALAGINDVVADFVAHESSPFNPHPSTFGGIGITQGVTSQAILNGSTAVALTVFNTAQGFNDVSNDCTSDKVNNRIAITRTGRYKVDWSMSVSAGTNNIQVYGAVIRDGTAYSSGQAGTKLDTSTDVHFLGGTAIIDISSVAGTDGHLRLGLWHSHGGSVDLTPKFAGLVVVRLGDSP